MIEIMANKQKKKSLLSIETNSTDYTSATVRYFITMVVLLVPLIVIHYVFEPYTYLRLIIIIPAGLMFFCTVHFFAKCLMISDNRKKAKVRSRRYKEKYRPVRLSKEDFVYLLKHADLSEALVLKSKEGKYASFELSVYEGVREFSLDDKEYKTIDSLLDALEEKGYLRGSLTVCEITDHNKPQLIFKVIDNLMEKEGFPPFCR